MLTKATWKLLLTTLTLMLKISSIYHCFIHVESQTRIYARSRFVSKAIYMSHNLLWRHIILLTVSVYSSNHGVLYIIAISIARGFHKSESVCLVIHATKYAYSSFVSSRIIISISGERAWWLLQETDYINNIFFGNFRPNFRPRNMECLHYYESRC